jgi:hypothetical protein
MTYDERTFGTETDHLSERLDGVEGDLRKMEAKMIDLERGIVALIQKLEERLAVLKASE